MRPGQPIKVKYDRLRVLDLRPRDHELARRRDREGRLHIELRTVWRARVGRGHLDRRGRPFGQDGDLEGALYRLYPERGAHGWHIGVGLGWRLEKGDLKPELLVNMVPPLPALVPRYVTHVGGATTRNTRYRGIGGHFENAKARDSLSLDMLA